MASSDIFIKEKKKNILNLVKNIGIDYDPKLKSAFDEYSEALAYLRLKNKFEQVERVPETKEKTPDFKIEFENFYDKKKKCIVYAELKTMSFSEGNLNYKRTMEHGLAAQIDIESQLKRGNSVAFGLTEIQPMFKDNKEYDSTSIRYAIETIIDKIEQNIKENQFTKGETVLIVDLKQLTLPTYFIEGAVPISRGGMIESFISGVQWNVALGKVGHLIFKPIEFEGKENTDGELQRNGILISHDFIKAIIFFDHALGDKHPKIVGLHRTDNVSDCVETFLHKFCDFVNDDRNCNGWRLDDNTTE